MAGQIFIIAEAGVNHNGNPKVAFRLVRAAAYAGADAVKFQTFSAEALASRYAERAAYQKRTTGTTETQVEMLRRFELDRPIYRDLMEECRREGIHFLSSPFDLGSIELLKRLGLSILKIPSGEITNLPYLEKIGGLNKEVILSTGMADLDEIEAALRVLSQAGTAKNHITLLHCNSAYPTPFEHVNLKAMLTLRDTFGTAVGYSDHSLGIEVPTAAAALGASVIEKHITLDKQMLGPDHKASADPVEFTAMVRAIRKVERALGDGVKEPSPSELENRAVVRKSLVAARNISKGEVFTKENLTIKRPGHGISPMLLDEVIGRKARKDFRADEVIDL